MRNNATVAATLSIAIATALHVAAARSLADDPPKQPAGVYVAQAKGDTEELIRIPGQRPQQVKTKGIGKMLATQGLLKPSMMMELAGPIADVRVTQSQPVFYIYIDAEDGQSTDPFAGVSAIMSRDAMPQGARTGADFSLVYLTVAKESRQADLGKVGGGGKMKDSVECAEERLAQGVYRLRPKSALKPGEYAFFFTGQGGSGMNAMGAWPFGVDLPK